MKQIISLFLLVTSLGFTGCYDLDRSPFDDVSSTTMWLDEDQCKQGVVGVYARLHNVGLYSDPFKVEVGSEACWGYNEYVSIQNGTRTASSYIATYKWKGPYTLIQRANTAMVYLADADIDATVKSQMIAEMKFLRGLGYLLLVSDFGGVPIYDETTDYEQDYADMMELRSTEAEVYAFIAADFAAAAADLPVSWDSSDYGRATQSAAYAMLGKTYLFAKDYANAITYFEKVLDPTYGHELYPTYADLFLPGSGDNDESSEMIFAVQSLGGVGQDYGIPTGLYLGTRPSYGSCWNNVMPSSELVDSYELLDGQKFDWEDLIPGYTTDQTIQKEAHNSTFSDDAATLISFSQYKDQVVKAYDPTYRDPRLAATVITPHSEYVAWVSDQAKTITLEFGINAAGSTVYPTSSSDPGYLYNNIGSYQSYFFRKFVPEGDMDGQLNNRLDVPINYAVIRLADVYLMLAEAYNEQGNQTTAISYINKVRERAGIALINNGSSWMAASTYADVFERISHERMVELVLEGHREKDLRRWGIAAEKLSDVEIKSVLGNYITTRKFYTGRDELWPIPQADIDINAGLTQNPGW